MILLPDDETILQNQVSIKEVLFHIPVSEFGSKQFIFVAINRTPGTSFEWYLLGACGSSTLFPKEMQL